jgi:hypothetical protein
MVNAPKNYLSPLPAGKYGKLTKLCTRRHHHMNKGNSGLEVERVRALEASHSLRCKKKLSVENRWETHLLSNEGKENWIEEYVDGETVVARKRVQDAATAIIQE